MALPPITAIMAISSKHGKTWDAVLGLAGFACNDSVHSSINCTPFECDLGYTPSITS